MNKINIFILLLTLCNSLHSQEDTSVFHSSYLTKEPEFLVSSYDSIPLLHFNLAGVISLNDTSLVDHLQCQLFKHLNQDRDTILSSLTITIDNIPTSAYNTPNNPSYFIESKNIYFAMHNLVIPNDGLISISAFNNNGVLIKKEIYSLDF